MCSSQFWDLHSGSDGLHAHRDEMTHHLYALTNPLNGFSPFSSDIFSVLNTIKYLGMLLLCTRMARLLLYTAFNLHGF